MGTKTNKNAQNHIQITSYHTILLLFSISFLATSQLEYTFVIFICLLHSSEMTKLGNKQTLMRKPLSNLLFINSYTFSP